MSVTLWGHWTCPYVNRVDFALAQRGIDFELVSVPPSAVRPKDFVLPEAFVEHSPRLEVPMVCVDGDYLADSIPVLHFLEDRVDAPSLRPADIGNLVDERVRRLDETLMRSMGGVAYGVDDDKIRRSGDFLAAAFLEMTEWLAESEWLAGDTPTLAEAIAVSIYLRLEGLQALGFTEPVPAAIVDHRERTMALPGGRHVAWNDAQRSEYLSRHEKARERARGQ